ncbi:unnamed protein product [Adineta steineri]|uniref:Uncharacterized protein n=1 Tax=Adineta steineri TaxID=433720 RepID=A0A813N433_9BILA|nr:unnamed protein product [Adineta steineri]CAF0740433.1 unnamed protein product [Adineta steineri]CAF0750370.1 unnamed protein product [Adineta steineri]
MYLLFFIATTTTQNSVCTISSTICSTPLVFWNNTGVCTQSSPSYRYFSCCYQVISTQLSIEFKLIEQIIVWHINDVSMTQGNGELIDNGDFEMNFTGWTIPSSANLLITPLAYYSPSVAYTGSIHLYSTALSTPDKIKQTVNISFWWYDESDVAVPTERCEGSFTLL